MSRPKLFQYAVIFHPQATKEQTDRGEPPKSQVITEITTTIARSENEVAVKAARSIPDKFAEQLDDVEIVVRPF